MSLLPGRLGTRKFGLLIVLPFVIAIAAVVAYLVIFSEPHPGELVEREIAKLEKVIEQYPDATDKRVELALLYSGAGSQRQAIAQLQMVLEVNNSHQGALVALGDVYMELGHYEEATGPYLKVIELNEDNPMRSVSRQLEGVYYFLGTAYYHLGKLEDAIQSLEEALAIDRTDADAWYIMGATYQQMEEYKKAIESFEQAVRFVPSFIEAYQGLAQCYEKTGQANFVTYANAMISYNSGSPDEAIRQLETVIAATPDFAEAHLGLGLAYEKEGEIEKAISAYHKALEIDPGLWLAQAKLRALGAIQE